MLGLGVGAPLGLIVDVQGEAGAREVGQTPELGDLAPARSVALVQEHALDAPVEAIWDRYSDVVVGCLLPESELPGPGAEGKKSMKLCFRHASSQAVIAP